MHELCKKIHVATISITFLNDTSHLFIMIIHLPFRIPKALSTHIRVVYWIKFQFVWICDNFVFPPLNGQYIYGLMGQAALICTDVIYSLYMLFQFL